MTTQTTMPFGAQGYVPFQAPPPPFVKHSDTSRDAAKVIKPDTSELRSRVYHCIKSNGANGRTDDEIQIILAMAGSTERPRRRELQLSGRIRESDMKRKTATGRLAVVWLA